MFKIIISFFCRLIRFIMITFDTIDPPNSIKDVERLEDYIQYVTLFRFILLLIRFRSFNKVVICLNEAYNPAKNFVIRIFWFKFYILQTKKQCRQVLSKDIYTSTKLTFANQAFFNSHGHWYGVGNLQSDTDLWKIVHDALLKANSLENKKRLQKLLQYHKPILLGKYGFEFCVNDVLEEYVMTVWAKYCFGNNTDYSEYKRTRDLIIDTLKKTFYNSSLKTIPKLGSIICSLKRLLYTDTFRQIDNQISLLIRNGEDGYIHHFMKKIEIIKNCYMYFMSRCIRLRLLTINI